MVPYEYDASSIFQVFPWNNEADTERSLDGHRRENIPKEVSSLVNMWRHTIHHLFPISSKYTLKIKLKFPNSNFQVYQKHNLVSGGAYFSTSSETRVQNSCQLEAVRLKSRSLISVSGVDSRPFLQGLITNDLTHLESKPSIFTLFLNHQGRVLYDAILYTIQTQPDNSDTTLWIECDSTLKEKFINHLKIFKLRKSVDVCSEDNLSLWVVYDPAHSKQIEQLYTYVTPNASTTPKNFELTDNCCEPLEKYSSKRDPLPFNPRGSVFHVGDPRVPELGWRVLLKKGSEEKASFPSEITIKDSEEGYKALRFHLGVGEGNSEIPSGSSFPLEANGDFLHGVSFHKGCYIGQELTARTHHTGVIRKRLMPFKLLNSQDKLEGNVDTFQIISNKGRPVGKIRAIQGNSGLALVRIEEALAASELKIEPGGSLVSISKPLWWPIEASKEIASKK